jgi:phage baseplate assembly protein W
MAVIRKSQSKTQTQLNTIVYSDIFTNMNIHPSKLDLVLHYNEDSVSRSIKNILLTSRGERLFDPGFGSDIKSILFENFSPQTETMLREYIKIAIQNYEPRANLLDVAVSALIDQNSYAVTIVFSVINRSEPVTLQFLLNRIR